MTILRNGAGCLHGLPIREEHQRFRTLFSVQVVGHKLFAHIVSALAGKVASLTIPGSSGARDDVEVDTLFHAGIQEAAIL